MVVLICWTPLIVWLSSSIRQRQGRTYFAYFKNFVWTKWIVQVRPPASPKHYVFWLDTERCAFLSLWFAYFDIYFSLVLLLSIDWEKENRLFANGSTFLNRKRISSFFFSTIYLPLYSACCTGSCCCLLTHTKKSLLPIAGDDRLVVLADCRSGVGAPSALVRRYRVRSRPVCDWFPWYRDRFVSNALLNRARLGRCWHRPVSILTNSRPFARISGQERETRIENSFNRLNTHTHQVPLFYWFWFVDIGNTRKRFIFFLSLHFGLTRNNFGPCQLVETYNLDQMLSWFQVPSLSRLVLSSCSLLSDTGKWWPPSRK